MGILSRLFGSQAHAEERGWIVKTGTKAGKKLFVRKNNGAGTVANRKTFNYRLGFAFPLNSPNQNGDPSQGELAELNKIEDLLVERLEKHENALQVLAIRGPGFQEYVFYVKEEFAKNWSEKETLASIKSHKVQSYREKDADWTVYYSM